MATHWQLSASTHRVWRGFCAFVLCVSLCSGRAHSSLVWFMFHFHTRKAEDACGFRGGEADQQKCLPHNLQSSSHSYRVINLDLEQSWCKMEYSPSDHSTTAMCHNITVSWKPFISMFGDFLLSNELKVCMFLLRFGKFSTIWIIKVIVSVSWNKVLYQSCCKVDIFGDTKLLITYSCHFER